MKIGFVLGAGGTAGLAYHAGALHALVEAAGLDVCQADLIVGTSAGSVAGAYLRSGWSAAQLWEETVGSDGALHSDLDILAPAFTSPLGLMRRALGSAYVVGLSLAHLPSLPVPGILRHAFPGGLFSMVEGEARFATQLNQAWPDQELWLCATDLVAGGRIVLGRDPRVQLSLPRAVMASCAIPAVYSPVRSAGRVLVDGGLSSTTNLDLATLAGCDVIIGVAPMAYDPSDPPCAGHRLFRRIPSRALSAETAGARRVGARVVLIRPTSYEVDLHGLNLMRRHGLDVIAQAAYDATARLVGTERFRRAVAEMAA